MIRTAGLLDHVSWSTYLPIMATHVNIGDAETRLSELVAAAVRGEDIILDKAGYPQVRLVPIAMMAESEVERLSNRRRRAIGMFRQEAQGLDIDIKALKAERVDADHRLSSYIAPSS
jgi:prevent-host-death family protein